MFSYNFFYDMLLLEFTSLVILSIKYFSLQIQFLI
jgi:hypothetical protein